MQCVFVYNAVLELIMIKLQCIAIQYSTNQMQCSCVKHCVQEVETHQIAKQMQCMIITYLKTGEREDIENCCLRAEGPKGF